MIPGDLLSAFPHRQFHTLPGLLDSWAACVPMQGGSLYHFYDGLGMTRPRGELTTYRARGGHATNWANPTRYRNLYSKQATLIWVFYIMFFFIHIWSEFFSSTKSVFLQLIWLASGFWWDFRITCIQMFRVLNLTTPLYFIIYFQFHTV